VRAMWSRAHLGHRWRDEMRELARSAAPLRRTQALLHDLRRPRPAGGDSAMQPMRAAFVVRDNLRQRRAIERSVVDAIRAARSRIDIAVPYFYPGQGFRRALRHAGRRGERLGRAAMAFARLNDPGRAWDIMSMINPINHALSPEAVEIYKVEPYVVAADIYALPPHTGRGGWTWYTGSAGWMYRLILEYLLGLRREGNRLSLQPCLPHDWDGFGIRYRFGKTVYDISVTRAADPAEEKALYLDGSELSGKDIPLLDDGGTHQVRVIL